MKTGNRQQNRKTEQDDGINSVSRDATRKDRLFDELFNTYHKRIYYITRRYTRNDEDAFDLVQEIFIKAYRALDTLEEDTSYAPWLYRIAVNHSIDHVRKKRHPEFSYDEFVENGGAISDSSFQPADDFSGSELHEQVLELVNNLSPEHRAVLLLHCMENLPYKQISRVLNCSIGTVMSRLHYARKYLKQAMEVNAVI